MSDIRIEQRWFDFLNRKYVQRSDARQKSMGLQYMEAETHDLARECARFEASLHPSSADIPAKAREMLAEEYERNGMRIEAKALLQAGPCSLDEVCALSVIERALTLSRLDREAVAREAQFLCDRLDEFDPDCDDDAWMFYGHVSPSHARLKSLLSDQSGSSLTDEEYKLPCDVRVPPNTVIRAGCKLSTLMFALSVEGRPRHFKDTSTPPQAGDPA